MGRIANENRIKPLKNMLQGAKGGLKLLEDMSEESQNVVMRYYAQAIIGYLEETLVKAGEGIPIVAHNFGFPTEILHYYDTIPVCVEALSYAMSGESEIYYDLMNNFGHPHHTCTAQKGVMGMMLDNLLKFDLVATISAPCDNAIGSYPAFKYLQKKVPKIKIIDMPYHSDERSCDFLAEDLLIIKDEIGNVLEQDPDENKFRNAIKIENRNLELIQEIHELKKAAPCPIESVVIPVFAFMNIALRANSNRTKFLEKVLEYTKGNYKKGIKPNGEEKIRTIWPNMAIYFDANYCDELDQRKKISVLFDVFTYLYYEGINLNNNEDDIIKQLAKQCLNYPMTRQVKGDANQLIEDTLFLCKEFKADAAIFTNHIGCKSLQPMVQLLREALREELELPFLSIDLDVGDKRVTPIRSIKRQVNTFVKTLF